MQRKKRWKQKETKEGKGDKGRRMDTEGDKGRHRETEGDKVNR